MEPGYAFSYGNRANERDPACISHVFILFLINLKPDIHFNGTLDYPFAVYPIPFALRAIYLAVRFTFRPRAILELNVQRNVAQFIGIGATTSERDVILRLDASQFLFWYGNKMMIIPTMFTMRNLCHIFVINMKMLQIDAYIRTK